MDAALARVRGDAEVEVAEPLVQVEALAFTPNDPEFGKQWNLRMIHMPEAWERSRGKGVMVAVIDTGIAYEDRDEFVQVPDLAGRALRRRATTSSTTPPIPTTTTVTARTWPAPSPSAPTTAWAWPVWRSRRG